MALDTDTAMPVRETVPGLGHAVELRVYRAAGVLHLDWWYDTRRLDPTAGFARPAFAATVVEFTREAVTEDEIDLVSDELASGGLVVD